MLRAPKVRGTEKVGIEKASRVGGTNWKGNVNASEHSAYIGESPLEYTGGSKSKCVVWILAVTFEQVVEHDFIADRNPKDVTRAVYLQGLLQGRLLALIVGFVDVDEGNTREDFKINLGLLDSLQDEGGLVACRGVEPKSGCDL